MRQMKDSGIDWIGQIPQEWDVCKFKNAVDIYNGNSIKDEEKANYDDPIDAIPYVATKDLDVTFQTIDYDNGMYVKNSDVSFKRAPKGSTLLCIEGGSAGKKIAFTTQDVCFINKLCCFHSKMVVNKYIYYFMQSPAFREEFRLNISGLIGGVSINELKDFPIILPAQSEQVRIVDFLDDKCAEIDVLIAAKEKTNALLRERRQSIIYETVTKGLNPNAPMKDSVIEWIGQIPEHWSAKRIKHLGTFRNGLTYSPDNVTDSENSTLVLRSSNIQKGSIVLEDNVYVDMDVPAVLQVSAGDILICSRNGSKELIGKNAIIPENLKASFGAFMMIFRCDASKYLYYILNSNVFSYYLGTFLTSTVNQLTAENFGNMKVVYCDSAEEREKIVSYLDSKCLEIDNLISANEATIQKLKEYRQSVIYEAVTGKIEI